MEIELPKAQDILVIDDMREFFFDCVYARNFAEAIAQLAFKDWELVLWDHDLGGDNTIRPVVRFLANNEKLRRDIRRSFVITDNPAGAEWLMAELGKMYGAVIRVDSSPWITRML